MRLIELRFIPCCLAATSTGSATGDSLFRANLRDLRITTSSSVSEAALLPRELSSSPLTDSRSSLLNFESCSCTGLWLGVGSSESCDWLYFSTSYSSFFKASNSIHLNAGIDLQPRQIISSASSSTLILLLRVVEFTDLHSSRARCRSFQYFSESTTSNV
ncbi:hypothetical protein OGAPHI_000616 [Ogataea philodendri]|uniref:Uncharacterized protein n=1 Tax=Ogataea philodendri TaxID=1378263 RepID=A0A9P8PFY0_9ASCO|nr:uncharacterized protein OGAPHI_000616 [Ogataea philodendri]KAH3670905.1 hypothetical protein OGAPHI_000616 [Ogataea philodendri]